MKSSATGSSPFLFISIGLCPASGADQCLGGWPQLNGGWEPGQAGRRWGAPSQQEMLGSDAEEKEVLGVLTRKPTEKKAELKSWEPATLGWDFTQKAERETRSLNDPLWTLRLFQPLS